MPTQGRFEPLDYAVLGTYLAAMVVMGWCFSRREKTADDYFRGGRRVPWWAAGLSIFGTALSAITFMAIPASTFAGDWTMFVAHVAPIVLVPIVAGVYIPFYRRLDVTTPYEYLQKRFNTPVRLLASAQWILFQFARMSIVLYLPSLALSAATGLNVYVAILAMGVLATLYTVLGGIEAVIWTDVVQVVVLLGGAVLSVVFIACRVDGGLGGIIHQAAEAGKFHAFSDTWSYSAPAVWVLALGAAVGNFGVYTTDQALVQRYMSTPTLRQSKAALWTSALGGIPTGLLFFFLGTALWAFYRQHGGLPDGQSGDAVFPIFIVQQLPAGVSGLLIAGIFAAAMSTIDSGVNSITAAVTTDFVRRFRPAISDRRLLRLARVLTVVAGAVGTALALTLATWEIRSQYSFFLVVLGLFTGGLAGLFALGLFTRRASAAGGLIGAAASAALIGVIQARPEWFAIHKQLYGVVAFGACIVAGYVASLLLPSRKNLEGLTVFTTDRQGGNSHGDPGDAHGQGWN